MGTKDGIVMVQWWKPSPPTNVARFQFQPGPYVSWWVVGFLLDPRVVLQTLQFSFLHKNQHSKFQFNQDKGLTWKPAKADTVFYSLQFQLKTCDLPVRVREAVCVCQRFLTMIVLRISQCTVESVVSNMYHRPTVACDVQSICTYCIPKKYITYHPIDHSSLQNYGALSLFWIQYCCLSKCLKTQS